MTERLANDAELREAYEAKRAELKALLTPETLAALDAYVAEAKHRLLFGDGDDS